ncbi:uncharacterized protein DS421_11g351020 [Arachis hypogaea]|nr:uncharacterized protein DS421_11g351020 [Arachis hypogaea]
MDLQLSKYREQSTPVQMPRSMHTTPTKSTHKNLEREGEKKVSPSPSWSPTPSPSTSPRLPLRPCFTVPRPRLLFLVVVGEVVVVVVVVFLALPASPPHLSSPSLPTLRYPDSLPPPPRSSTVTAITG